MPATFETKEIFPGATPDQQIDTEVKLRLKASAIRSRKERDQNGDWLIITEWNVIGE
jgi:hypothetical protein